MEGDEELDLVLQKEYEYAFKQPDEDDDDYWHDSIFSQLDYLRH